MNIIINKSLNDYGSDYMESINRTLKYVDLLLVRGLDDIPVMSLPEGFRFVLFQDGDEKNWVDIEVSSGEFLSFDEGIEAFNYYYGHCYEELKKRCIFIENNEGEKVATTTAFYADYPIGDITGYVHWVSVKKEYQGKGLSKPLVSMALLKMKELGHKGTFLHTQTHTWLAVKVYLDMGFVPILNENDYLGWQIIKNLTNHKTLDNVVSIPNDKMYEPLYVKTEEYLKSRFGDSIEYKVWDKKGPIIGVRKDGDVFFFEYSFENGELKIVSEKAERPKLR